MLGHSDLQLQACGKSKILNLRKQQSIYYTAAFGMFTDLITEHSIAAAESEVRSQHYISSQFVRHGITYQKIKMNFIKCKSSWISYLCKMMTNDKLSTRYIAKIDVKGKDN